MSRPPGRTRQHPRHDAPGDAMKLPPEHRAGTRLAHRRGVTR